MGRGHRVRVYAFGLTRIRRRVLRQSMPKPPGQPSRRSRRGEAPPSRARAESPRATRLPSGTRPSARRTPRARALPGGVVRADPRRPGLRYQRHAGAAKTVKICKKLPKQTKINGFNLTRCTKNSSQFLRVVFLCKLKLTGKKAYYIFWEETRKGGIQWKKNSLNWQPTA